jgi:signal transduction histidine kinase
MERHGGAVRLRSTPGEGTEVHLSMPVDGHHAQQDEPQESNA